MNYNDTFEKAIRKQQDQGHKAQFSLLVKANKLEFPIDVQKLVFPIMLYGCEIWGTQPQDRLEIFYQNVIIILTSKAIDTQLHGIW